MHNHNIDLSDKTIFNYQFSLKKISDHGIDYNNVTDLSDLKNKIQNINAISDNNLMLYYSALLWHFKQNNLFNDQQTKIFSDEIKFLKNKIKLKYHDNKLSFKEKQVYLEWNDIQNAFHLLYQNRLKNFTSMKNCICIALYVLFPPRRLVDYSKMIVKSNTDDINHHDNFYIINPPLFIFNQFKTKNKCDKIFDVPANLQLLLNEYIYKFNIIDKNLLDINENALSSKIKKIMFDLTGKKASINTFRHSYISYMQNNGFINSTKLKKELAAKMGHNFHTQQEIYVKFFSDSDYNSDSD